MRDALGASSTRSHRKTRRDDGCVSKSRVSAGTNSLESLWGRKIRMSGMTTVRKCVQVLVGSQTLPLLCRDFVESFSYPLCSTPKLNPVCSSSH